MSEGLKWRQTNTEETPDTVFKIEDPETQIPLHVIYSNHILPNVASEIGDARALALEMISDVYRDDSYAHLAFLDAVLLHPQYKNEASKAFYGNKPLYFTDTFLPNELRESEKIRHNAAIVGGMAAALGTIISLSVLERVFSRQLDRRSFLRGALNLGSTAVVAGGAVPLAHLLTGEPTSRSSESGVKRKIHRGLGWIMESTGMEAQKMTIMFRNLVMAYKVKYVAHLLKSEDPADRRHITMLVGSDHYGIERLLPISMKELGEEILRWISEFPMDKSILESIAHLPETRREKDTGKDTITRHVIPAFKHLI